MNHMSELGKVGSVRKTHTECRKPQGATEVRLTENRLP